MAAVLVVVGAGVAVWPFAADWAAVLRAVRVVAPEVSNQVARAAGGQAVRAAQGAAVLAGGVGWGAQMLQNLAVCV